MILILGIGIFALSIGAIVFSLPRGGRTARFVGSEWEGYVVVAMIGSACIGLIMTVAGLMRLV